MKPFILFIGLFLLYTGVATGEHLLSNTMAPEFNLYDQYCRQYSLQSFARRPLVLLASDKEGEEQNYRWAVSIQKKYEKSMRVLGVADVRNVPFFLKGKVRNDFKKYPNSILLDWNGVIFTAYRLTKGVPNVVLIDSNGYIRYLYAGGPSDEAKELLFKEIDRVKDRQ
jgi:hypothetical protein